MTKEFEAAQKADRELALEIKRAEKEGYKRNERLENLFFQFGYKMGKLEKKRGR